VIFIRQQRILSFYEIPENTCDAVVNVYPARMQPYPLELARDVNENGAQHVKGGVVFCGEDFEDSYQCFAVERSQGF
jgi:hypothetical protein